MTLTQHGKRIFWMSIVPLMLCSSIAATQLGCRALCISQDSLVDTPRGPVPIQDVIVGQEITVISPQGSELIGRVVGKRQGYAYYCTELGIQDIEERLVTSDIHPVSTYNGYHMAKSLGVGELVNTKYGLKAVQSVTPRLGHRKVYDLSVEPYNVFIANNIHVHNKSLVMITRADIHGSWVGPANDALNSYCRLDLHENGTGTFWLASARNGVDVYEIQNWDNKGHELAIRMRDASNSSGVSRVALRAQCTGSQMPLQIGKQRYEGAWDWSRTMLLREAEMKQNSDAIQRVTNNSALSAAGR